LLQAKLEEMDKKVSEAIRRRNREDRLLFVALVYFVPLGLGFLITKFISRMGRLKFTVDLEPWLTLNRMVDLEPYG
jgi:hypothetical protein